jgi:hypothetical protein
MWFLIIPESYKKKHLSELLIGAERIDLETDLLFKKYMNDPDLAPKFQNINSDTLKQTH